MNHRARYRAIIVAVILAAALTNATAQPLPDDHPRVQNWLERMSRADSLLNGGHIGAAIDELEDLREDPHVRGRSEDYPNLLMNLARAYAWWGDPDRTIERLTEAMDLGHPVWREIATSKDFVLVKDDERFARLVEMARQHTAPWEHLWKVTPSMLAWRDTLSVELRAFGVSSLWSAAKHSYAYFERLGEASWDSIYIATLRQALATPSTFDNYRLLQRMAARLGDGHTWVVMPPELSDNVDYAPPVLTALVEDRVIVTRIMSPALSLTGIAAGDEIIAIDSIPVADYVERRISPWIAASSPQDRAVRTYDYYLLAGPSNTQVLLSIRSGDGSVNEHRLERTWCRDDLSSMRTIDVKRLHDNVGYVAINTFDDEYVVELFDRALDKLGGVDALIIDLRDNTGGQTRLAFEVLSRLIDGPFETHLWATPVYRAYFHARGRAVEWFREPAGFLSRFRTGVYGAPVILLVGPRTLSAAENFAVAFDYARRGMIVGEPTAGSTGHTLEILLPAGGACRITTTRDCYPDGRVYNGVGVIPTVTVRPTHADVRAGRDSALAFAQAAASTLIAEYRSTRSKLGIRERAR